MKKLLFINACIRPKEISRTAQLCQAFLQALPPDRFSITEKVLEAIPLDAFDGAALEERDALCARKEFQHPRFALAHEFAAADLLVVSAPYWDLAFPAKLKIYLEHVCVSGITFDYCDTGFASLCRAEKLVYITTAGGQIAPDNLGYDYMRRLCLRAFGVENAFFLAAEGLDAPGATPPATMQRACREAKKLAARFV